jgi:Rad3-related DNA helicase
VTIVVTLFLFLNYMKYYLYLFFIISVVACNNPPVNEETTTIEEQEELDQVEDMIKRDQEKLDSLKKALNLDSLN